MAEKTVMASRLFNKFLKLTLGNYMRHLFKFQIQNEQIASLEPPYVVIANHTNLWDPFLLSMCFSNPIHFVTSDAYFKNPILKYLLKLVGAIPKVKFVSDPNATRDIFNITKLGGIVCIYPEGRRNWDGKTLPLIYATAKLIKSLDLPVVSVLFKGAHLSMPRWAKKPRKGYLMMQCNKLLEANELAGMTVDDVFNSITKELEYDEYTWQSEARIPFTGKKMAESLELFLFGCPNCKSIGSMISKNEDFHCTHCNYSVKYDKYGYFKTDKEHLFIDNPKDWNIWQLSHLENLFDTYLAQSTENPFIKDVNVLAQMGNKMIPFKRLQCGTLEMYGDKLLFIGDGGLNLEFPLKKIYGENIQSNRKLEFYYNKVLYRFTGNSYGLSAYKWVKAIEIYKNNKKNGIYTKREA